MIVANREFETILVDSESGVAWVRLNRPDRRNAISTAMRSDLQAAFGALEADDDVIVVVLTGVGTAFCAGVDLAEASATGPAPGSAVKRVSDPLDRFTKPVIAAVNGPAVGGGLELALAADVRIAAASSVYALPEVKLGSLPGSGGTQRLPQLMSPSTAARMILSGEVIDAEEALRIGLVSNVYGDEAFGDAVAALATTIAANAPLSLRAAKLALRAAQQPTGGLELERQLWALLATTSDREEGRVAFRERRPPRFTGN